MLELYLEQPNKLNLREVEALPAPQDREVKIKIVYGGICGSDLRVYKGKISYAEYPIRPGHEVVGVVTEVGKGSKHVVGTKVVVFPNTFCEKCEYCLTGKTNICKGKKPLGVAVDGVFAQEILIDSKYAIAVPSDMQDERAILVEPFAVTVHALKKASISKGSSVAIVGTGTEGLLAAALANKLGANVTAIDINPTKLELARKIGCCRSMLTQEVSEETFDVVIEAAGAKEAIEKAIRLVKPGGTMIALGVTGDPVTYDPIHIVRSEIDIRGTIIYTLSDFSDAIDYLCDPTFNVDKIILKFFQLKYFNEAFQDAFSGNFAKIVLDFRS